MQRKPQVNTGSEKNVDDFIKGAKDTKTDGQDVKQEDPKPRAQQEEIDLDKNKRATYYISQLYIEAIEQMAFYEKMDKSEIVREALKQYIPSKYVNLAVKRVNT